MSTPRRDRSSKRLPVNPSLENLKKQAKRLLRNSSPAGQSEASPRAVPRTLQQAQHQLAKDYGCANWAELAHIVQTMSRGATQLQGPHRPMEPLPAAANRSDLETVHQILRDGPFTQHDLDLALARCVLRFNERRAIAELLIDHGADPDGQYGGNYGPIVFVTGECLDADGLQFLIDHGADVTFPPVATKYGDATPMSYTLGSYARGHNDRKHRCIDILLRHGALMPPEVTPEMFAVHRGDATTLAALIKADPSLLSKRHPDMPYGNMNLRGATLVHLAVEFGELECLRVLLDAGADINARAIPTDGIGDQTPIFHAISTNQSAGLPVLEHLVEHFGKRIDLSAAATFRVGDLVQMTPVTPLEYAEQSSRPDVPEWRRATSRELELLRSL